ncbi:C4-type zinc ribbon domain-containing protein [Aneurinibacillus sp. UBA3580]|jgi:predicted  nucleic acid-binding Zn-ribbon protein|uniref:C4-type zinc ribbon domain-containing protein n=1 Tax=Aneurinibacillus sp. UBA3580 TaxID=1946041 RepID=UPI00257E7C30|nr:C4-type zinc ribbon domain-containing protein [Aneurinibacillus sp. UBA3580]
MMIEARRLLEWHQAKEKRQAVQKELDKLRAREEELAARRQEAEAKIRRIGEPSPDDIDGQIELKLAQQELWLVNKDTERFMEEKFEKEFALMETRREWEEKTAEREASLSPEALALYHRIRENISNPVVEVRRRSCMGCFLPLSVAKMEEWHKGKSLVTCDECGRILV